jgi:hypothetical protein
VPYSNFQACHKDNNGPQMNADDTDKNEKVGQPLLLDGSVLICVHLWLNGLLKFRQKCL